MEKLIYTITYFENGKFFMVSSNAFISSSAAVRCARRFCNDRNSDGCVWTYDIDELILR